MPKMLKRWRKKKSWKLTLPLCRMYASKRYNRKGMSLRAMCRLENNLTLNRETGFNEFVVCDYKSEIPPEYQYLTGSLPKYPASVTAARIAKMLIGEIEKYFVELWDSNRFHLVFCSGGLDSRIMSLVLSRLRKKKGRRWLGDIHFRCHEPEGRLFNRAMAMQGWKPSEYSVYKEGRFRGLDYFSIGKFNRDVNAFHRPLAEFWDDLLTAKEERKTVLVTGSGGGELFSYPLFKRWRFTDNRYEDFVYNTRPIVISVHRTYNRWNDVLSPFLGYGYLDRAFRVPKKYFKWVKARCYSTVDPYKGWQKRDLMRMALFRQLRGKVMFFVGHEYNLKISRETEAYMKKKYRGSKFYRDFRHLDYVRRAQPWSPYVRGRLNEVLKSDDGKLYGYAAMYQGVKR